MSGPRLPRRRRPSRRPAPALLLALALTAAGCAGSDRPADLAPRPVTLAAGPNINRYAEGPSPVVLRLYQLASRSEFEAASFWDLYERDAEILGGALVDKTALAALYPDESRDVTIDFRSNAHYVAVFAEFAAPQGKTFSGVAPIDPERLDDGVRIEVSAAGVAIARPGPTDGAESWLGGLF